MPQGAWSHAIAVKAGRSPQMLTSPSLPTASPAQHQAGGDEDPHGYDGLQDLAVEQVLEEEDRSEEQRTENQQPPSRGQRRPKILVATRVETDRGACGQSCRPGSLETHALAAMRAVIPSRTGA